MYVLDSLCTRWISFSQAWIRVVCRKMNTLICLLLKSEKNVHNPWWTRWRLMNLRFQNGVWSVQACFWSSACVFEITYMYWSTSHTAWHFDASSFAWPSARQHWLPLGLMKHSVSIPGAPIIQNALQFDSPPLHYFKWHFILCGFLPFMFICLFMLFFFLNFQNS